jgi:hypothetical protein
MKGKIAMHMDACVQRCGCINMPGCCDAWPPCDV